MLLRTFILAAACWALVGCGVDAHQKASRTLTGVTQQHVLIAAQHTLADKGLDVEELDFEKGVLKSSWDKKIRKQFQYDVSVLPQGETPEASGRTLGGGAEAQTVVITVAATAREKVVGGWSDPIPASTEQANELLDDIVELSIERFDPGTVEITTVTTPKCSAPADCPIGQHCGSGRCVQECVANTDCESGNRCDDRGRCIPPEPPPCPTSSAEPEQDKEDKKSKRRKRREHNEEE